MTGCSSSETQPKSTVEAAKPYNDADIAFATDMIQHHAQALQMVDMTVLALLLLLVIQVLNLYKPPGMTRYGWRKANQERLARQPRSQATPEV